MNGYSNSEEELQRLAKLQRSINKKAVEKKYSDVEKRSMKLASDKFKDNLKTDGRAQPLRQNTTQLNRSKKYINKFNVVTNITSQVNWSEDGLYFVAFIVSVMGDVGTAAAGAVQAIPGVGWALGAVLEVPTQVFVLSISAVIALLYMLNGHYKRRKAIIKISVLLGFSFMELIPVATALPGFIGSFIINYTMVLYDRAMDDALKRIGMAGKVHNIVFDKNKSTAAKEITTNS